MVPGSHDPEGWAHRTLSGMRRYNVLRARAEQLAGVALIGMAGVLLFLKLTSRS